VEGFSHHLKAQLRHVSAEGFFFSQFPMDYEKLEFKGVGISDALQYDPDLTWMEKCLAGLIDTLSFPDEGPCHASCEFLARRMHSTTGSIRTLISHLMKEGVVWKLKSDGHTTWRCLSPVYSGEKGKYRIWLADEQFKEALTQHFNACEITLEKGVLP
jgi:hypothetical protein